MRARLIPCVRAALVVAGCGGGKSDEDRVRETLERLEKAVAAKDYRALCDDILSRELVTRLRSVGLPCPVALQRGLGNVQAPTLDVLTVRLRNDRLALAEVRTSARGQRPSTDTFRLLKEGERWRVGSLSGAQPPAPQGPREEP